MRILVVDNEELAVRTLCNTINKVIPDADITSVTDSREALDAAFKIRPEIAFLDIDMPGVNGLMLAKAIKEQVDPKTNIIFTTGYSEYLEEAFTRLRVSGYLLKPITPDMVKSEIDNLRYPIELKGQKRIRIRTFGTFEVYVDDKPVNFHYSKTKELLACLVDSGGMCSIAGLQDILWEDTDDKTDHRSYLQNMVSDLVKEFGKLGCSDLIIRKYGEIGIDSSKIDCDYYEYRQGNPAAVNAFKGIYMSQYSWAENTLGNLVFHK